MMWGLLFVAVGVVGLIALYFWSSSSGAPSPQQLSSFFSGRVIWVTGASSGIGKALALCFAEYGATVILSGRDKAALVEVQRQCQTVRKQPGKAPVVLPFDLAAIADPAEAGQLKELVRVALSVEGRIDALVNNGGLSVRGKVTETSLAVDHQLMNVNYFGTIALTKAVLPHLARSSSSVASGHLLLMSSVQGLLGVNDRAAYSASKHALHGWADSLRYETSPDQLSVTLVCPGYVRTNLSLNALSGDGARWGQLDESTASGMSPDEVAHRCLVALYKREAQVIIADVKTTVGVYLRLLAPKLLTRIMRQRAEKQNKQNKLRTS